MNDYKPRPKRQSASFGSTLLGIFIGLLLGFLIAAAIAVYMMKSPLPFVSRSKAGDRASPSEQAPRQQRADASKAAAPVERTEKPKLDFYKILPGQEAVPGAVPETAANTAKAEKIARAERPDQVEKPAPADPGAKSQDAAKAGELTRDLYVIQAGSFQNPVDADNVKAKLALLGLQASIEPAALADKGTWYRVRLGPYRSLRDINAVRGQLAQAGVDATLLKVKE